jgi:hypothetical protein
VANPSYLTLLTLKGQILYSGQLATTAATAVYTVPASTAVKLATCTICNTSAASVLVTVSLLKSGDTADSSHRVMSAYPLAAGDTVSLREYLSGAMLQEGESISVQAGTAAVLDVVLTGSVST